ncbi:MAG: SDR family NAD(P)-dependent oxidoreductase [Deltaproteobacteria bacterium]|nr:SDR family NAD(P)-dependent oxidoreductase [Deltaproteobacteria bacterium]
MRFTDRAVYITGAGAGLGRATAQLFAAEGAKVFVVDLNGDGVVETVNGIRAAGGNALGGVADVSDLDSVAASVEHMVEQFGGLNLLVNVAGVGKAARFEEIDEREWSRTMAVNLNGVFHTTKAALPHLLAQKGGAIVNVASIAGLRGQAYCAAYCASKAGMINFTRTIALEFASRGLRANCVAPGGIQTDLIGNFIPREDFEPQLIAYYSPPPPGRLAKPEDVANSIAFLASREARMINGAVLTCDGGTLA